MDPAWSGHYRCSDSSNPRREEHRLYRKLYKTPRRPEFGETQNRKKKKHCELFSSEMFSSCHRYAPISASACLYKSSVYERQKSRTQNGGFPPQAEDFWGHRGGGERGPPSATLSRNSNNVNSIIGRAVVFGLG